MCSPAAFPKMSSSLRSKVAEPNQAAQYDLFWAGFLSAVVYACAHAKGMTNFYVINDDARQQLYWMQAWMDPGLYQGHWLTEYARHYVSFGVRGVYWLASHVIHPLIFSKVVTGVLYIVLGTCFFSIGRLLQGRALAWTTCVVFWLMPAFLDNMSGGLARAFAAPLLAFFILFWLQRNSFWLGMTLVLQALFIPYICFLCSATLGLSWCAWRLKLSGPPPLLTKVTHFVVPVVTGILVYSYSYSLQASGYGPMVTEAEMIGHPEFGEYGRFAMLPVPSVLYELVGRPFERILPFREWGVVAGVVCLFVMLSALVLWARQKVWRLLESHAQPFLYLLLASIGVYYFAKLFLLKFFIPSRYLEYTTVFLYCVLLAHVVWPVLARWMANTKVATACILAMAVLAILRLDGIALHDYSLQRPLFEAVRETPKDAIFAGHPHVMDNVLTFGQRSVLASYELAHPWSKGLWTKLKPRLFDVFSAYYASDPLVVREFAMKYGVDYFVVDDRHFTENFIERSRVFMPFYEAAGLPESLQKLFENLGWDITVLVRLRPKGDFSSDHPFFAPFDQFIQKRFRGATSFALLSGAFSAQRISKHITLIDVRTKGE